MSEDHAGFDEMSKYPLFEALHKRRSRRIGLGLHRCRREAILIRRMPSRSR